jgi:hypothetical protein
LKNQANVDLTNASAVISYDVAQHYLSQGIPTISQLNSIIEKAAPKMRFIRELLTMNPDKYENVDMDELLCLLVSLFEEKPVTFRKWFPIRDAQHLGLNSTFHGDITEELDFKNLQDFIEGRTKSHTRTGLSFWFKGQAITGCFDVEVRMYIFIIE